MTMKKQVYVQSNDSQEFKKRITDLLERGGTLEPHSLSHSVVKMDNNQMVFLGMAVVNIEESDETVQARTADQRPG